MSTQATVLDDRYVLEEVIGRGGVADVHRATDRALHRSVAVKLLREITASDDDRSRFASEARTLARLSHPGLVAVLDAGSADLPYLVMELVTGPSLAICIERGALGTDRVVAIGIQLADALAYAHGEGVVHRDVKPGNVMLADDGRTLLTDFGIARLYGDTARHTRSGLTVGSPAYLSPEQIGGADITPASDIYSLGLVLIEALTGERAFRGPVNEAAVARLARAPRVPDDLPPKLSSALTWMTALDPAQRPNAADVGSMLRSVATPDTAGVAGTPDTADASVTQVLAGTTLTMDAPPTQRSRIPRTAHRAARPDLWGTLRSRVPWPAWAAAAVVLVMVVAVLLVLTGGSDETGGDLPPGVPTQYQQPLRDLHDAVEGENQ